MKKGDDETSVDELDALLEPAESEDFELEPEEDDEAEDDSEGQTPKTVPYSRFRKLVAQRNAVRRELKELEEEAAELRGKSEGLQQFQAILTDRYGRFKNAAAQLTADADFMEALEALAKTDAEALAFYRKVNHYVETGEQPKGAVKAAAKDNAPEADPRIGAILARENERVVSDVLAPLNLEPRYLRLIQNHVRTELAASDSVLDAKAVQRMTKGFMESTGFTLDDMRAKAKDTEADSGKPVSRKRAAAAGNPSTEQDRSADQKELSREEILRRREKLLDSVIEELSA